MSGFSNRSRELGLEVLRLSAQGLSLRKAAAKIGISQAAVSKRLGRLLVILGAKDLLDALRIAEAEGLLEQDTPPPKAPSAAAVPAVGGWPTRGSCRTIPTLFEGADDAKEAVHICLQHCPVLDECRDWAVGAHLTFVTAGGIAWNSDGTRRVMGMNATTAHSTTCRAVVRALEREGPG